MEEEEKKDVDYSATLLEMKGSQERGLRPPFS